MERSKLIPELSEYISVYYFSSDEYFIHQEKLDHRIKISKETHDLIKRIDGKKTLEQLSKEVKIDANIDFLYELLYEKLGKYGIIKNDYIDVKKKEKPSYLKLSFIVIPSSFISKITPYLKFLFRPKVMKLVIFLCFIIMSFSIVTNYNDILNESFEKINWILFFTLGFISVTFHEFGHVTATEFFGAKHGGIGGGFYLFTPVYFADVTDIWKLKPNQRIIVNLAGIYFELIMCTLYVLLGLYFEIVLLIIIASAIFLKTLFNLNPFLRSDGYWVLTDFLGIANLYKVSNNNLLNLLKSFFNRNLKFNYSKKSIFLSLYASVNYILLIVFVGYVVIFNSNSVIHFPINAFNFIKSVVNGNNISLVKLAEFIMPSLFYYLLFNFIIGIITRRIKKHNTVSNNGCNKKTKPIVFYYINTFKFTL